jgi:hypothetical protein
MSTAAAADARPDLSARLMAGLCQLKADGVIVPDPSPPTSFYHSRAPARLTRAHAAALLPPPPFRPKAADVDARSPMYLHNTCVLSDLDEVVLATDLLFSYMEEAGAVSITVSAVSPRCSSVFGFHAFKVVADEAWAQAVQVFTGLVHVSALLSKRRNADAWFYKFLLHTCGLFERFLKPRQREFTFVEERRARFDEVGLAPLWDVSGSTGVAAFDEEVLQMSAGGLSVSVAEDRLTAAGAVHDSAGASFLAAAGSGLSAAVAADDSTGASSLSAPSSAAAVDSGALSLKAVAADDSTGASSLSALAAVDSTEASSWAAPSAAAAVDSGALSLKAVASSAATSKPRRSRQPPSTPDTAQSKRQAVAQASRLSETLRNPKPRLPPPRHKPPGQAKPSNTPGTATISLPPLPPTPVLAAAKPPPVSTSITDMVVDLTGEDEGCSSTFPREWCQGNVPATWTFEVGVDTPYKAAKKTVAVGSAEYNEVIEFFKKSMWRRDLEVVELTRIQNLEAYESYETKRKSIFRREGCTTRDERARLERKWLFHGTDQAAANGILQKGLDRNYNGKNATAYGKGVYFARDASFSHQYTSVDADGCRLIFLCRVTVGVYAVGSSGMQAPPMRDDDRRYDSTVDYLKEPTKFVTFNDAQAYTDYLVKYKTP